MFKPGNTTNLIYLAEFDYGKGISILAISNDMVNITKCCYLIDLKYEATRPNGYEV